jgi:hypothetical protein
MQREYLAAGAVRIGPEKVTAERHVEELFVLFLLRQLCVGLDVGIELVDVTLLQIAGAQSALNHVRAHREELPRALDQQRLVRKMVRTTEYLCAGDVVVCVERHYNGGRLRRKPGKRCC